MISAWHKTDKIERNKTRKFHMIEDGRRCCLCGLVKLKHHFGKDKSRKDGIDARCKQCNVERVKNKNRLKGIEERALVYLFGSDF
jgi:hypothetical protein